MIFLIVCCRKCREPLDLFDFNCNDREMNEDLLSELRITISPIIGFSTVETRNFNRKYPIDQPPMNIAQQSCW